MSVSKSRPSYRPNVETLESRMQPGSILTGGLGVSLLGSALDLSSLLNESGTNQFHTLNHLRAINNQSNTNSDSSQVIIAPSHGNVETSQSATPVATNSTASSNLANQMVAVNAASHAHAAGMSVARAQSAQFGNGVVSTVKNTQVTFNSLQLLGGQTIATLRSTSSASVHPATSLHGTGYSHQVDGIQPDVNLNWISFFGHAGSAVNKVAVTPDGSGVLLAGTLQNANDPTINDAFVAELDSAGQNLLNMATVGLDNLPGSQASANGLAVDGNGNIYASGSVNVGGSTIAVAVKVDFAMPSGYDWLSALGFASAGGAGDVANSCQLDAAGATLYVAGTGDASPAGGGPGALELSALTAATGAGTTYGYNYNDSNGNPMPVVGNDIAPTSTGGVDVAVQLQTATGNLASFGVASSAATGPSSFATIVVQIAGGVVVTQQAGPRASMNSIAVDSSNNIYVNGTGYFNDEGLSRDIVGFAASDGSGVHGRAWGVTFGGVQGNWVGTGLVVNSDHTPVASGTVDDNSGTLGSHGDVLIHTSADALIITDNTSFGNPAPFGSNDDYGTGVAMGNTLFGAVYYQGGYTDSPDFNVTAGAYQTLYGGDPNCGWIAQISLT
jgi:hypothetical protein